MTGASPPSPGSGTGGLRRLGGRLPIVPADARAGPSLVAVLALLAFLAALAAGAAALVADRSAAWGTSVAGAATIQVRPVAGRDLEADLARSASLARATGGVRSAKVLGRREAEALLEPWLGRGLDLSDLPLPRLVALDLDRLAARDLDGLAARLAAEVPGASLDDHGAWLGRLSVAVRSIVGLAVGAVVLVLVASAGAVAFAVRGAMSGHRDLVEVLHYAGADDAYIAGLYGRRFVRLGLAGGLLGAVPAGLALAAVAALLGGGDGAGFPAGLAAALRDAWPAGLAGLAVALAEAGVARLATGLYVRRVLAAGRAG